MIDQLSHEEAKAAAKLANEALIHQKVAYDELLKHRWGLEQPVTTPTQRFGFSLFGWWLGIERPLKSKQVTIPVPPALVKVDPGSLI